MKLPFTVSARARVLLMLVASGLAILTCGTHYSVSAWSPELKHKFNCTQSEISAIGEIGGMSSYLSPLSGVVVYALPEWLVSTIVMGCSVIGYLFMGLAVRSSPGDAMYPLRNPRALGVLFCLQGFGSFTLYKLGLVVNVHNMPVARRGSAVALLAACLGISASVFTLAYNSMDSDVAGILFIMGFSVMGMSLLCALFVRRVDPAEAWGAEAAGVAPSVDSDAERPMLSTHGSFVIPPPLSERDDRDGTGYLRMPANQLDEELMYGSTNNNHTSALGVETPLTHLPKDKLVAPHFDSEEARLQYEAGEQERAQLECQAKTFGGGLAGQVFGAVYFLVRTRTYWIMMIVFILVAGSGSVQINNTGHIVQSLNGGVQDGNLTTMLILLLSLSNASGRLLMGLSDVVPIRKGWWLVGVCAFMSLTHLANAWLFTRKELVIFGVIGIGLSYGGLWAILPIIVSEYFGPINFSMNLGWISFASGLGGLFCNHYTGVFYDNEAIPGSHDCVGPQCFRYGFILCACAAALGMLFALPLVPLTQRGRRRAAIAPPTKSVL